MENNNAHNDPNETRGWEIVKQLNALAKVTPSQPTRGRENTVPADANVSLESRQLLAEYIKLPIRRPSRLHSAILSSAAKMAMEFPDFHFVPFLEMWGGMANIRKEDHEAKTTEDGKRFPSLMERLAKGYAYSQLFHADQRLKPVEEQLLKPMLQQKGYQLTEEKGELQIASHALATKVFTAEVRNRKMTFVSLLTPEGEELVAEVHTLTQFGKMRYADIPNRLFRILLRASDKGNVRIEAACLSHEKVEDCFPMAIGYIDRIDPTHHHIHVFDNESRHFVSRFEVSTQIKEGTYVRFLPIFPKEGDFKSAIILSVLPNSANPEIPCGPEAFGYRDVQITYVNQEQGYCAWELLPEADGQVHPIVETGAKVPMEPVTQGYLHKTLLDKKRLQLPKKGDRMQIISFLKRGKDGKKHPVVVDIRLIP